MPRWAWYAAGWFGGRALLTGLPLDQALKLSISNPFALPDELRAIAARPAQTAAVWATDQPTYPS